MIVEEAHIHVAKKSSSTWHTLGWWI